MSTYQIHIPIGMNPRPEPHEFSAAELLAQYFQAEVSFVMRSHYHTADFMILGQVWELKSPVGNGKNTLQRNMHIAEKQAANIIYDTRRTKVNDDRIKRELEAYLKRSREIKRLLMVTKSGGIIEIPRG